ncbi:MAG: hypothetical protein R6U65_05040 [Perlabentimonas sp.]
MDTKEKILSLNLGDTANRIIAEVIDFNKDYPNLYVGTFSIVYNNNIHYEPLPKASKYVNRLIKQARQVAHSAKQMDELIEIIEEAQEEGPDLDAIAHLQWRFSSVDKYFSKDFKSLERSYNGLIKTLQTIGTPEKSVVENLYLFNEKSSKPIITQKQNIEFDFGEILNKYLTTKPMHYVILSVSENDDAAHVYYGYKNSSKDGEGKGEIWKNINSKPTSEQLISYWNPTKVVTSH